MKLRKVLRLGYCILFFGICAVPFAGMAVAENTAAVENTDLAEYPKAKTEEGWNREFLSQWGEWFEDHFALRQELITANSLIRGDIFQVSGAPAVVKGTDGWLYYQATIHDYLAQNTLTDRELYNIAHNLALIQEYVQGQGSQFLFTVAPNKNTVYGENMPYYYQMETGEESNLERLVPYLETEGVAYVDLVSLFKEQDEILYHARDSHWDNRGAMLVQDALLDALGKEHKDYSAAEPKVRADFVGDLDRMVFPLAVKPEVEYYYEEAFTWRMVDEESDVTDLRVLTSNPKGTENLLMYRDSFGNSLLPFMADAYANGCFSQQVPYQLPADLYYAKADAVILEKVERHLSALGSRPAVMPGPVRELDLSHLTRTVEPCASFKAEADGDFWKITGELMPQAASRESRIYVRIDGDVCYECFPVTVGTADGGVNDYGYQIYLTKQELPSTSSKIEVLVENKDSLRIVYTARDGVEQAE